VIGWKFIQSKMENIQFVEKPDKEVELETIEGEIMFKRVFGKKLSFFSVKLQDCTEVELTVTKSEDIKTCKIGFTIRATGTRTNNPNAHCLDTRNIEILQRITNRTTKLEELRTYKDQKQEPAKSLCKRWKNKGECDIVDCKFRHFLLKGEIEKLEKLKVQQKEMYEHSHFDDPLETDDKCHKDSRNSMFAMWLVETFGLEYLKKGPILDIAGGKGYISYFLSHDYGLDCIVVDPRGTTLPKKNRRWLNKVNRTITEKRCMFDDTFDLDILASATLIFGMHPDEATEPIVDMALKHNIPFAVVPCCVFPTKFIRFLKNGDQVILYVDFIKYLLEKIGSEAKVHFLNIEGKNKVLYKKID
jgi:hypothetical protein